MAIEDIKARDVMIKELVTIGPDEKIALADLIMTRHSIGALPVVKAGKIVGIITQRDIMLAKGYDVGGLTVKDLMSKELITVERNTPIKSIISLLLKNRIERLPVVDGGKLVGLIVHDGILKAFQDAL